MRIYVFLQSLDGVETSLFFLYFALEISQGRRISHGERHIKHSSSIGIDFLSLKKKEISLVILLFKKKTLHVDVERKLLPPGVALGYLVVVVV